MGPSLSDEFSEGGLRCKPPYDTPEGEKQCLTWEFIEAMGGRDYDQGSRV